MNTPKTVATTELLPRHPLSRLTGEITPDERAGLIADLSRTDAAVVVDLLEGSVIYDWHRYRVAVELGKIIVFNELDDDDPPGYLISRLLGNRTRSRGQQAAIEVTLRSWQSTGRPRKPANNAVFSERPNPTMTTMAMAREAHVCATYIQMAKRVYLKGGFEVILRVINEEVSLSEADMMLSKRTRPAGVDRPGSGSVVKKREQGTMYPTPDDASEPAGRPEETAAPANRDDGGGSTNFSPLCLIPNLMRVSTELKRDNERLVEENRTLRDRVARLRKSQATTPHQAPQQRRGVARQNSRGEHVETQANPDPSPDAADGQTRMLL